MEDTKKFIDGLYDLQACPSCLKFLEKFPSDGPERSRALTCAAESKDFNGCRECLWRLVIFVRAHSCQP